MRLPGEQLATGHASLRSIASLEFREMVTHDPS